MLGSPVLPNSALLGPRLSPSLSLPLPNTGSGSGKMTSGPRDGFPRSRDVYRLDYPLCLFKSIEPAARSLPHSLVARMALLTHKPYQGKWGHSARLDQSGSTSRPGETAAFRVKWQHHTMPSRKKEMALGQVPTTASSSSFPSSAQSPSCGTGHPVCILWVHLIYTSPSPLQVPCACKELVPVCWSELSSLRCICSALQTSN